MTRHLLFLALVGCSPAASDQKNDGPPSPQPTETPALQDDIELDALMGHLQALQDIADANGGNRAAGTPGFEASVEYAVGVLEDAGYTVTREPFSFLDWVVNAASVLEIPADGTSFQSGNEIGALTFSQGGDVTAEVTAVDLVLPPTDSSSSTSGCEPDDFIGFPAGNIALIQRGQCLFNDKALNAQNAGASAVIVFNEGQPGRRDLEGWQLDDSGDVTIPVLGASFSVGDTIAAELANGPVTLHLATDVELIDRPSENVIVETDGDPDRILVVGGHIDSVVAGPGINDNGTGTALVLELAVQMARSPVKPKNTVRFALWGSEELGLLGSNAHVDGLDDDEIGQIIGKLNFDMVGSPNGSRMIYDGDGDEMGIAGPDGSDVIEQVFETWFEREGLDSMATLFDGRSDYLAFILEDIPAGGLFTGAEQAKTPDEAEVFGGDAFVPRDACYHLECDDIDNVDQQLFLEMSKAAAYATWDLADRTPSWVTQASQRHALKYVIPEHGCGAHQAETR